MMDSTQHRFFAPCPRGLEAVLEAELHGFGIAMTQRTEGGVAFQGSWTALYRANLESRIASRVLWEVGHAPYRTEQDVYHAAHALTWTDWFEPSQTIKVKVSARRCPLPSLDFVTLRIKDAICDRFMKGRHRRPSVETARPDIRIDAFLDASTVTLYLDTSGEPLFKRGHRLVSSEAPLRENLAVGLLHLAGWSPADVLLDPMCGGGTIAVEAVLLARRMAPGMKRSFAFERLSLHDPRQWSHIRETARRQQLATTPSPIYASDEDPAAIAAARRVFQAAGVAIDVRLKQADFFTLEPPAPQGVMLINPPYGVRLGERERLEALYPRIGDRLKQRWPGWRVYIFTADPDMRKLIGLTPSRRIPLFNGSLECRLYEFQIVAGSMRRKSHRSHGNG